VPALLFLLYPKIKADQNHSLITPFQEASKRMDCFAALAKTIHGDVFEQHQGNQGQQFSPVATLQAF